MMKSLGKLPLILILLSLLSVSSWADKVYLKNGDVIEGTVYDESGSEIKMQVNIGTIKENRTYSKDEVEKIEKPKPEDVAFEDLKGIVPVPDLSGADEYRKRIKRVDDYLTNFALSPHVEAVKGYKETLDAELEKVMNGATQFNGEWLSAAEKRMHDQNIEAEQLYGQMLAYANRGGTTNLLASLRTFERLDSKYEGTQAHAKAVETTQQILNAYGRALNSKLTDLKAQLALEEKRSAMLTEQQKAQLASALAQEQARFESRVAQEGAAGLKWLSPNFRDEKVLNARMDQVRKELDSLAKVDVAELKKRAETFYEVESQLAAGNVEKAESLMSSVSKSKNSKNEYIASLQTKMEKAKAEKAQQMALENRVNSEASKLADAVSKSTSGSANSSEEGAAEESSAQEALNMLASGSSKKTTTSGTEDKPKKPEKKSASSSGSGATQPAPVAVTSSEGGFNPMFLVAAVLILATVGIYFFQKKKAAGGGGEE